MSSSDESRVIERRTLLHELRSIVEGLLGSQVSNVWNVYGGLNRLHTCIEKIFRHGSRVFDSTGDPDCWVFIQGLNWLQPSLATSPSVHESDDYLANLPARISSKKDLLWIYKSLENHSLSPRLSWLLSDKEHLLSCLEPWAFLRQENLAEATLICLRAVEKNQPILLTEIDPCLFLPNGNMSKNSPKRHRRSSSYPTNLPYATRKVCTASRNEIKKIQETSNDVTTKPSQKPMTEEMRSKINSEPTISKDNGEKNNLVKVWNSLPSLSEKSNGNYQIEKAKAKFYVGSKDPTLENDGLSNVIKIEYAEVAPLASGPSSVEAKSKKSPPRKIRKKVKISGYEKRSEQTTSKVDGWIPVIEKIPKSNMRHRRSMDLEMNDARNSSNSNSSTIKIVAPKIVGKRKSWKNLGHTESTPEFSSSWTSEVEGQKDTRVPRKSFMEDGGSSVQPMATGYFPRPTEGQSLTSFLSSAQFSRANAELDRENAHFSISEAMIAAIEQVKCNGQIDLADETIEESDEEINRLKQRIRLRRRQRQQERRRIVVWNRDLLSDGKTDTTTTDQSISPLSSSPETPSEGILTDDVEDLEVDDVGNLSDLGNSGISISMASLYSEAELHRSMPLYNKESTLTESIISAEGVALSLIRRFSEKQLPRASELEWLVSEQDAPQQLLPLPLSWPVSPDELESENMILSTPLRGTMEWAPPRAQIIFTPQPKPERRSLMGKQNYRCAGCGMKVAVEYANRFRYCEYLGRYFCTGCHTNQLAVIPGKILQKWDFNRYPVSNFSYRLLDQMSSDPLFHVNDLCPMLYRRVKQLDRCRLLRTQLFYLKDFIYVCRFADDAQEALRKEPTYVVNDPHVYAIQDFVHIKFGDLSERLKELVLICSLHVSRCELCQARGFVCELCCSKEIIFPWQLTKVARCDNCGACFHTECRRTTVKKECPKCTRLAERRSSRNENC